MPSSTISEAESWDGLRWNCRKHTGIAAEAQEQKQNKKAQEQKYKNKNTRTKTQE